MNLATRTASPRTSFAATAAVALAALLSAPFAGAGEPAQSWEYKSYKNGGNGGTFDKEKFVLGTISIEQKDSQWYFRMAAGRVDACYRGALPATVTRTETITTIEVTQAMAGCEQFRYQIRNDGSGGNREHLAGEAWVKDRFDHGLTPVKQ